ncbi:MAG: DUF4476 domain-containing protein [Crocinitomix sp.]|nr:DUF4476 domain-containing protein [Crocinitomix sp.]
MKRQLLLLTFLFSCLTIFAQRTGDATFYSNTGKKFFVVLNGIRQNTEAQNNVKVSGLSESYYSCRIIAEDKSFNLEKNIGVKKDTLVTYRIIEKKGKYKLRYYSESALGTAPAVQDQVNVVYHNSDLPENTNTVTTSGGNVNTSTNGSTSTTTTSTSTNQNGNSENVSIDINLTENGMGANISIQGNVTESGDGNGGAVVTSTSTETTTTSSSSTTTINGVTTHSEESSTVTSSDNNGVTSQFEETTTVGSDGNIYTDDDMTMTMESGCGTTDQDMQEITAQISNEAFPDDKLRIAKLIAAEKCMTVDQIKTISQLFSFDDNKMEFIKAAHTNCMNQSDYHQLMEVFTFSDDKEALEKFILSK